MRYHVWVCTPAPPTQTGQWYGAGNETPVLHARRRQLPHSLPFMQGRDTRYFDYNLGEGSNQPPRPIRPQGTPLEG